MEITWRCLDDGGAWKSFMIHSFSLHLPTADSRAVLPYILGNLLRVVTFGYVLIFFHLADSLYYMLLLLALCSAPHVFGSLMEETIGIALDRWGSQVP